MDSNYIYFSDNQYLKCYDIKKKTEKWAINADILIRGSYKSKIVAQTFDAKGYIIVDKNTGKLESEIINPFIEKVNLLFMDNYILINSKNLYN